MFCSDPMNLYINYPCTWVDGAADFWHNLANIPDIWSREFVPSAILMCVKPISCKQETIHGLKSQYFMENHQALIDRSADFFMLIMQGF